MTSRGYKFNKFSRESTYRISCNLSSIKEKYCPRSRVWGAKPPSPLPRKLRLQVLDSSLAVSRRTWLDVVRSQNDDALALGGLEERVVEAALGWSVKRGVGTRRTAGARAVAAAVLPLPVVHLVARRQLNARPPDPSVQGRIYGGGWLAGASERFRKWGVQICTNLTQSCS